jgi:hypothetical protein
VDNKILSAMRWKEYFRAVIAIIILRTADLYITFLYTPDLTSEWNPLVSIFGLTWHGFVATQIFIILFISIMMIFYFSRKPPVIQQCGLSLNDFCYVYFFEKLHPWPQRMFTLPRHYRRHLAFNGFLFMVLAIGISAFAIINNILLISENNTYAAFVEKYHGTYFPMTFAIALIAALYAFFAKEFESYKRNCSVGN